MAEKTIMLCCAAGMSTSLLVSKMQASAKEQGLDYEIFATLLMPIKSLLRIRLTSFCSDLKFATWKLISKTSLKERIFL